MANPGPATAVSTHPSVLSSQQALRVLAVQKGVSVSALGDTPIQIVNTSLYLPTTIVIANANNNGATQSVASVALGIYTAPLGASGSGTAVLTTAALTGQTAPSYVTVSASTDTNAALTAQTLYVNQTTATATATVDIYIYGYDLSPGFF